MISTLNEQPSKCSGSGTIFQEHEPHFRKKRRTKVKYEHLAPCPKLLLLLPKAAPPCCDHRHKQRVYASPHLTFPERPRFKGANLPNSCYTILGPNERSKDLQNMKGAAGIWVKKPLVSCSLGSFMDEFSCLVYQDLPL